MESIPNTSILASAGTGKTFQLSDRIIALLASGQVKHDEIAALTFTRAAAAEFIVKVISKLKEAAENEKKHRELCKRLELSPEKYTQKHFGEMLRQALYASNRITMGTLDSFFAKLVNNFPLEVGLNTGSARTISDQEVLALRIRVLQSVLKEKDKADTIFNNLREYEDESDVTNPIECLAEMVKDYHGLFIAADDESIWGNTERIFGKNTPRWAGCATKVNTATNLQIVEEYLNGLEPSKKGGKTPEPPAKFKLFIKLCRTNSVSNSDLGEVIKFFDTILRTPEGKSSSYFFRKEKEVSAEVAQAIRLLVYQLVDLLINARLKQTRSLYQCLALYEKIYDDEIRRYGLLGFSDYVTLLTKADPLNREEMEFRLDCSIKHWLLDEFQDTSTLQYEVLRRNIDEIVANAPEDRSVFVVGDLKQSLYEWRSGNRKLLNNLNEAIKRNGKSIPLNETFRCSPAVLAMVNAVLDKHNDERKLGRYYSESAAETWSQNFQEQKAVSKKKGESIWVRLDKPKETDLDDVEAQSIWIAEHLKATPGALTEEIDGSQRLKPGITCAVLVYRNKVAAKITDYLRQHGIEATDEAKSAVINDNPVTAGILALIQSTIHPDNGLARGTAEISPATKQIIDAWGGWSGTCQKIALLFSEKGAEGLVDELIQVIASKVNHPFLRKRLSQLRALAVRYDSEQGGVRNLRDFSSFIEETEARDSADRQTVQVITIHRSKGLEYDMVYMPCLNDDKNKISSLRSTDLLFKQVSEDNFTPQWLLATPGDEVCALHPELTEAVARAKAENAYGSLCRLYVGMTRAKHRLVMLSRTISDDKLDFEKHLGKHDFASLLESTLGGRQGQSINFPNTWEAEQVWASPMNLVEWIQDRLAEEKEKQSNLKKSESSMLPPAQFNPIATIEKLRPSQSGEEKQFNWRPSVDKMSGKALGTMVHSLFEYHTTDTAAFLKEIGQQASKKKSDALHALAVKLVTRCVTSKAVADLLDQRSADTVVWREQKAVLKHEGKMIDAVFDRVHLVPGKEATIIDYKTNDCSEDELKEIYRGQMELYRLSIAELCGISQENIRCVLIHVRNGTLVEI